MKASTVFALAVSLLVGLAAAAGAKYAGLFDKKPPEPPPPPPPPVRVLVAKTNLYSGVTVTNNQVMVRNLSGDDQKALEAKFGAGWRDRLMPPLTTAAHLRTPLKNIMADEILFEKDFTPATLPDDLTKQLDPGMRAVNVVVPKDKAAGGTLRVGEYVDVVMTTKITYDGKDELRTATIAKGCKVIMKRNSLWTMMAQDPDDKPLHFTLQANPYRAALLEYVQTIGQLVLHPVPPPAKTATGTFSDLTSPEYATEDKRVDEINRGTRLIGKEDLVRIFQIPPPSPKPVPPQPVVVQHLNGVSQAKPTVFYVNGQNPQTPGFASNAAPQQPTQPAGGAPAAAHKEHANSGETHSSDANFELPSATGEKKECKSCEEKKRKAEEAKRAAEGKIGN